VAIFEDEQEVYATKIDHPLEVMKRYRRIAEQYAMRRDDVLRALAEAGMDAQELHAVVGRGGMLRLIPSGTYGVNARMLAELRSPREREHVSNLGALIAQEIAAGRGIPAYVVDPVTVDEFEELARVAGLPGIQRRSESHALNLKAAAREAAKRLGRPYAQINLVVVHLGTGISVSAHRRGKMVDVNQGLDGTGPFAPERAGGLPVGEVMRMAFSGRYTYDEMFRLITRQGGLVAHLGTNDAREVERRIAAGDAQARLVYEAMAYQVAKEIGLMATVLRGDVQAIVVTGGLAHSEMLLGWIRERVAWIAPVMVIPGEREMLAMAQGALRVLCGEESAKEY
jgi:butyrate kinase